MSELILRETFEEDGLLKHVFTKAKKHEANRRFFYPLHSSDYRWYLYLLGLYSPKDLIISLVSFQIRNHMIPVFKLNNNAPMEVDVTLPDGYRLKEFGHGKSPFSFTYRDKKHPWVWSKFVTGYPRDIMFLHVTDTSGNLIPFWEPIGDNFRVSTAILFTRETKNWQARIDFSWFLPPGCDLDAQDIIPTDINPEWRNKYKYFTDNMYVLRTSWNGQWNYYSIKKFRYQTSYIPYDQTWSTLHTVCDYSKYSYRIPLGWLSKFIQDKDPHSGDLILQNFKSSYRIDITKKAYFENGIPLPLASYRRYRYRRYNVLVEAYVLRNIKYFLPYKFINFDPNLTNMRPIF